MNRADKIALGFVGVVTGSFLVLAGLALDEQQRKIDRLKKRNQLLEDTVALLYRLHSKPDAKLKEDVIDHVIKYTPIPDDPRDLNK